MTTSSSGPKFRDEELSHEQYFELCALATSGTLTENEWFRLQAHLAQCDCCRKQVQEYREIARTGMALLMPEEAADNNTNPHAQRTQASWTPESAKLELFGRIARGDTAPQYHPRSHAKVEPQHTAWWTRLIPTPQRMFSYAAVVVVVAVLTVSAYRFGTVRGERFAITRIQSSQPEVTLLRAELNQLKQQRAALEAREGARSAEIDRVSEELHHQIAEVAQLRALQARTNQDLMKQTSVGDDLQKRYALSNSQAAAEREALGRKLQDSETALQAAQKQYDGLRQERSAELLRTASLENQIDDLNAKLVESETNSQQARQFLASDRDIRELMGARDLYIADVFDVVDNGKTQPPFGRVFYTKGKSLVFYAFDLDQQPHVQNAGIFQAWGRRGMNDKVPLNMGIFYQDSSTNKRWVLRFDNPQALAQIDAVFVTVEPHGGNRKPSGKQLLFASLRSMPNHP